MNYHGKVGIITGAGGILGKELTKLFGKNGGNLILVDNNERGIEKLLDNSNDISVKLTPVIADVTKEEDVRNYVQIAIKKYGKIDFLVNNAGIEGKLANLHDLNTDDFEVVMNINVKSVFLNIKYVIPEMIKQKNGSIVNIASDAGLSASPGLGAYVTSKHAVLGLTKNAAIEYAKWNIRVNSVSPGSLRSRMMSSIEKEYQSYLKEHDINSGINFKDKIPMKRFGMPKEVAELVAFLVSSKASFITGSNYLIDGGKSAW